MDDGDVRTIDDMHDDQAERGRMPLLVGEAPSRTGDRFWAFPLSGNPAVNLCRWAGWVVPRGEAAYWTLREHCDTTNLLERYPGPLGAGAAFPMALARPAWDALIPELTGRVVVLMGGRLGALAGLSLPHVWARHDGGFNVTYVPHPSGLNHVYNDPSQREMTGATLDIACQMAVERPPGWRPGGVG